MLKSQFAKWFRQNIVMILLPLWLIWLAVAFYYFASKDLVLFDPNDELASLSIDLSFDKDVVDYFQQRSIPTQNRVYHLLETDCRCNTISEAHRQDLNLGAFADAGYQTQVLPYQDFSDIIPSSPAVVIFNDNNELVYMGPYSAGLSCNSSNSFVEGVFKHSLVSDYLGAVIVHEAKGCYCQSENDTY